MKARVFGETAVVTGTNDETTIEEGKKFSDRYVWTDVFASGWSWPRGLAQIK